MRPAVLFLVLANFFAGSAYSQPQLLKVWPEGVPGAVHHPQYTEETIKIETGAERTLRIADPTIAVYIPEKTKANGTAVVVCPGGGYIRLAMDHEGTQIAAWLNDAGITCILLKYRVPSDSAMVDKTVGPLQDVQEAIRITRRHASAWHLDPHRIGVMGFSAGGHLAASASTRFAEKVYASDTTSARPDFSILMYPVISMQTGVTHNGSRRNLLGNDPDQQLVDRSSNELRVTPETPIAFVVHSTDDGVVILENSLRYIQALKKNNVPAELHVFERGGHGYGLATTRTTTERGWPPLCIAWLRMHGMLE
ncbi:MAG: alpha/beta hydrolase [Ignavibacteriae bacterium]|nr:alpha/beta hydrolase [Ignavibacteriota bacterium]